MEELLGTSVLDREILEDARKKASKILKAAGDDVKAIEKKWSDKKTADLASLEAQYQKLLDAERSEIADRMPLDKKRARLVRIEREVAAARQAYIAGMKRGGVVAAMSSVLKERLGKLEKAPGSVSCAGGTCSAAGLSEAELRQIAAEGCTFNDVTLDAQKEKAPALVLDFPEARIEVSMEEIVGGLLRDRRSELAGALLGAEALND
jgi:hypothetical protein